MTALPLLSVRDIVKSFGGARAVDGLSFEVRRGEVFGFLGPNGAGKTTTLRALLGIIRPDAGEIRFEGSAVLDRRRVGYLPEERGLLEDAVILDALVYLGTLRGLSRRAAAAAAAEWLERVGLSAHARKKLNTLSKGNQQKVQFAGAVLHRPALAVLDEPFSGLDPLNQELFSRLIRELGAQGTGVLLSAHHLNLAERLCDRFLLIAHGREALAGTLDEIRRAAAGGAGEVLELDLRAEGAPDGAVAHVVAALASHARGAPRAEARADGRVRVEAALPAGADLAPLLRALNGGLRVERVHMRALSLHEIYVRSVGGADAAAVEVADA